MRRIMAVAALGGALPSLAGVCAVALAVEDAWQGVVALSVPPQRSACRITAYCAAPLRR
jgi:hypothetical protein